MTLQTTGAISLANIQTEFGGASPISLSEYYAGGTYVLSGISGTSGAVPVSPNPISLASFYGTNGRRVVNLTITGLENYNYVLNTAKVSNYLAGKMDVALTITSGSRVASSSSGSYALTVDTSWAAGDTLQIVNSGTIIGAGGAGGAGGSTASGGSGNGFAGSVGGPAMLVQRAVTIFNAGTIASGGGGGGGGGFQNFVDFKTTTNYGGGGGGGGRGWVGGAGGAGGLSTSGASWNGTAGTAGTYTAGGLGGYGRSTTRIGGAGGALGSSGATGLVVDGTGGAGGAAGNYLSGNSFVSWTSFGTRIGGLV